MSGKIQRTYNILFAPPIHLVTALLTPRTRRAEEIQSLQAWRAWIGLAGLALILRSNASDPDFSATVQAFATAPVVKAGIAVLCFIAAAVVLVSVSGTHQWTAVLASVAKPLLCTLAVVAAPLILIAAANLIDTPSGSNAANNQLWSALAIIACLPLLPAAGWAVLLAVRYTFRASDIHPFMPAMVGAAIGLFAIGENVVSITRGGTRLDNWMGWFSLGGGVVVCAMSFYEIRFWHRKGVRWRTHHAVGSERFRLTTGVTSRQWLPWIGVPLLMILLGPLVPIVHTSHSQPQAAAGLPPAAATAPATPTRATPRPKVAPVAARPILLRPSLVVASSTAPDNVDDSKIRVTYVAANVLDGNPATAWRAKGSGIGVTLTFTFAYRVRIKEVGLIPGYEKRDAKSGVNRFTENRRISVVSWSAPPARPVRQRFKDAATMQQTPVNFLSRKVTITILSTTKDGGRNYTPISDVRFVGYRA